MALTTVENARCYRLANLSLETTDLFEDQFAWEVIAPQIHEGAGGGGVEIRSEGVFSTITTSTQRALDSLEQAFKEAGFLKQS